MNDAQATEPYSIPLIIVPKAIGTWGPHMKFKNQRQKRLHRRRVHV